MHWRGQIFPSLFDSPRSPENQLVVSDIKLAELAEV